MCLGRGGGEAGEVADDDIDGEGETAPGEPRGDDWEWRRSVIRASTLRRAHACRTALRIIDGR